MNNILDRITDLCLHQGKRILLFAAVIGLAALAATTHLSFDPDLLNLVPEHNVEINEFRRILEAMGTIDYHIVVLRFPEGADPEDYAPLVETLARQYRALPHVEEVQYAVPDPIGIIDAFLPHALLLLPPEQLDAVAAKLTDEAIAEAVERNRALLQTPQEVAMKDLVLRDPFQLLPLFLETLKRGGSGFRFDLSSGYYLSEDRSTLLILAKPNRPAQDIPFAKELMEHSEAIEQRAVESFRREAPTAPLPAIDYTGGYAIAFDDAELIRKDVIANVLFSFFGVLALFIYAFRRVAAIAYAGIPMSLGIALTFGLAGIVYGTLSSASAGFAALLAGLGIDFITVLYERYVEERNDGKEMPTALRTTVRSTMPGVIVAAITTAATFYAFLATDFRGMTQLGFLTGTGILLFFVCVALLLPALIAQTERRTTKIPRLHLHTFGSERLIRFSLEHPHTMLLAWGIFLIVATLFAFRLEFSDDIRNLRARGNRGVLMQEYVTERFGQSFDYMMLAVQGDTLEQTLERTAAAEPQLEELVANGTIAAYQSVTTFLPPPSRQREVIERLAAGRDDRFSPERIRTTFFSELERQGFRAEAYEGYMQQFARALTPAAPLAPGSIGDPAVESLVQRFLQPLGASYLSVIYLYPAGGVWGRDVPERLIAFAQDDPHRTLTGINLVSGVLRRIVRADAIRSTLLGFFVVFILLTLFFRGIWRAVLIFLPFLAGCTGMLGLMSVLGIQFNFMNVFVGLMLVGVGTDYGIYMLQRFLENPDEFPLHAPDTGKAVVMAALTSVVGYGSFAFSHYPGLRSIGYASTFGIAFSGLAAITFLPAMLQAGWLRKKRRES